MNMTDSTHPAFEAEKELMKDLGYRDEDEPVAAEFVGDRLEVTLTDDRVISVPVKWFPFLAEATPEQRADIDLGQWDVFWPALNEGVSVRGLLMGWKGLKPRKQKPVTARGP